MKFIQNQTNMILNKLHASLFYTNTGHLTFYVVSPDTNRSCKMKFCLGPHGGLCRPWLLLLPSNHNSLKHRALRHPNPEKRNIIFIVETKIIEGISHAVILK